MAEKQLSIADFYDDTVPVTVTHRGRSFDIECYPERATGEVSDAADAVAKAEGIARGEWHFIKTTVKSWTLAEEFGAASVLKMSRGLRRAIIGAVQDEATNPTPAESPKNSQSSSAPADATDEGHAGTDV
jgi:hypothetical protein